MDWGKKRLVDFIAGKTQLVWRNWSYKNDSIEVKMKGSILGEILSFKTMGLTFLSKLDWGSYIISIAKTVEGWTSGFSNLCIFCNIDRFI